MNENLGAWNGLLRISRVVASFIDGSSERRRDAIQFSLLLEDPMQDEGSRGAV